MIYMKVISNKGQAALSPALIMGILVSLIILSVGVYAFFTTTGMLGDPTTNQSTVKENRTYDSVKNVTGIGNQVFNVVGVVLVIGSIMLIVTMVYSYMKP